MVLKTLIIFTSSLVVFAFASNRILSSDFIESINKQQTLWRAKRNFPEDTPIEQLRTLAGSIITPEERHIAKQNKKVHNVSAFDIPETFDAREQWPNCPSLNSIRDQGHCGSCWAFAPSEAATDRICIHSNGAVNFQYSPEDILECCPGCYSIEGCLGGSPYLAWQFYYANGIVSGGDSGSNSGCKPYSSDAFTDGVSPTQCSQSCQNGANYKDDKHFGSSFYTIDQDVEQMQIEIMTSGPVSAHFIVYEDFYNYDSGVYRCTSGKAVGGHAIKIIGWGVEDSTPYWLVANSWGGKWGGLGGFFKILRGENHVEIEQYVYAGTPEL